MNSFEEVVDHFNTQGSLTKVSANELQSVRSDHAGIPEEYLRFLEVAGYGNLGDIQLYEGPTKAGTVYPNASGRLADILLIGDDFQGYCFGFDPTDSWRIVEVSPRGEIDTTVESEFLSLLDGYMQ